MIFGAGTIGLMAGLSAARAGRWTCVVEFIPERLDKAGEMGFEPIDFTAEHRYRGSGMGDRGAERTGEALKPGGRVAVIGVLLDHDHAGVSSPGPAGSLPGESRSPFGRGMSGYVIACRRPGVTEAALCLPRRASLVLSGPRPAPRRL